MLKSPACAKFEDTAKYFTKSVPRIFVFFVPHDLPIWWLPNNGWFISWKIPSFEMDDELGVPPWLRKPPYDIPRDLPMISPNSLETLREKLVRETGKPRLSSSEALKGVTSLKLLSPWQQDADRVFYRWYGNNQIIIPLMWLKQW